MLGRWSLAVAAVLVLGGTAHAQTQIAGIVPPLGSIGAPHEKNLADLLDQNKPEEAERFLLSLHWWSLPAQQDEVREMVVAAFKYILTSKVNQD